MVLFCLFLYSQKDIKYIFVNYNGLKVLTYCIHIA